MGDWHGARRLRAGRAKIDKQRRSYFQGGLDREIGWNMAQAQRWKHSSRRSRRQGDGGDAVFEGGVRYLHNRFIGSQAVRFNNDRSALSLGRLEQRPELFERDFLVAEINCRRCSSGDADDLLIDLRAERETGKRN